MKKIKVPSVIILISVLFSGCDPDEPGVDSDLYLYIGLSHDSAGSGALDEAVTSVNGVYSAGDGITATAKADSGHLYRLV